MPHAAHAVADRKSLAAMPDAPRARMSEPARIRFAARTWFARASWPRPIC